VVANGDVCTVADIERIKYLTGCEAVMICRATVDNPWIFARLDRLQVPAALVRSTMVRHLKKKLAFYGLGLGLLRFRKHASRYLAPAGLERDLRRRLLTTDSLAEFQDIFHSLIII
jgi:tRNA-dihydrouridine synthase B